MSPRKARVGLVTVFLLACSASPSLPAPASSVRTPTSTSAVATQSATGPRATHACWQLAGTTLTLRPDVFVDEAAVTFRNGGIVVEETSSPDGKNEIRRAFAATPLPVATGAGAGSRQSLVIEVNPAIADDFSHPRSDTDPLKGPVIFGISVREGSVWHPIPLDGKCVP